jgi:hypothetical protein
MMMAMQSKPQSLSATVGLNIQPTRRAIVASRHGFLSNFAAGVGHVAVMPITK